MDLVRKKGEVEVGAGIGTRVALVLGSHVVLPICAR